MNQECCNARTMDGPSKGTVAAVPFHRQPKRDRRPKLGFRLVLVLSPILPVFRKGCCLFGLMRKDGRKHRKPRRQCTVSCPSPWLLVEVLRMSRVMCD